MHLKSLRFLIGAFLAVNLYSCASLINPTYQVTRIIDGDTIELSSGEMVRLIQIDTAELSPLECYSKEATKFLTELLYLKEVYLETDDVSEDRDQFGRLLRYLYLNELNINLHLVENGIAAPYFFSGQYGNYANELAATAERAREKGLGLWGMCPKAKFDPTRPLDSGEYPIDGSKPTPIVPKFVCDPNYEDCIPSYPPDLDCKDIKSLGLTNVRVIGTDVHKLDFDGDGIACES